MQRMRNICRNEKAPYPKIEFTETHFYLTFRQSRRYLKLVESEKVEESLETGLNERQRKIIEYVKEHEKITNREYRRLCNIGWDTAYRDLQALVDKKIFKREGAGRATYYRMIIR